jgi:hypothetical protein
MAEITGNEPVYAKSAFYHPDGGVDAPQSGLTIRQHFAAMAMQGLLANNWKGYSDRNEECDALALAAVNFSDALIETLNKNNIP